MRLPHHAMRVAHPRWGGPPRISMEVLSTAVFMKIFQAHPRAHASGCCSRNTALQLPEDIMQSSLHTLRVLAAHVPYTAFSSLMVSADRHSCSCVA